MTDLGQVYMVKLEPGLHPSRLVGLMHNIRLLPGVVAVADLAAITQDTLDAILLAPVPVELAKPSVAQVALL